MITVVRRVPILASAWRVMQSRNVAGSIVQGQVDAGCARVPWSLGPAAAGGRMMHYAGLVLIGVCLAASGYLHAATAPEQAATAPEQKDAATAPQTSAGKPGAADKKNNSRRSKKSVTTFKPSERIGADSTVSFPVDI